MINGLISIFTETTGHFQGQEAGEQVLLIAKKHWFALIAPFFLIFLGALVPVALSYFFSAEIDTGIFIFLSCLWYCFLWFVTAYILMIYALKTIIITNRRLIENDQMGFFNRKVSEFHLYRVQDISLKTTGFFETLLGFGTLTVQTAAEDQDFVFYEVAHAEEVKGVIMRAVEKR